MKEALSSPYNKLIFRETFRDEQSVRRNGGNPTNVTFANGVGSFNGTSSYISYKMNFNGTYSARIKMSSYTPVVNGIIFDMRDAAGGAGAAWAGSTPILNTNGATKVYVDGAETNVISTNTKEIVLVGIPNVSTSLTIGSFRTGASHFATMSADLVEIYQGTLTASEVKNLYENKWNKEVSGYGGQMSGAIIRKDDFTASSDWFNSNVRCSVTHNPAGYVIITQNHTSAGAMYWGRKAVNNIDTLYYLRFRAKSPDITESITGGAAEFEVVRTINAPSLSTDWQTYEFVVRARTTTFRIGIVSNIPVGSIVEFDDLMFREVQPDLLLDFDSTQGTIKDRTGKNTLTPTDVSIKKIGQSYSADLNGTTSLIDTGSDWIGTKAITVCGWIKPYSWGEGGYGRIIDNAKTLLWFNYLLAQYVLSTTTGNSIAKSATNSVILNKLQFLAVTRTSAGVINFYIGDKTTAPLLSGSANQTDGTPVAGTTNVIIGNNSGTTRTFDGNISELKVYENILSIEDITNIWSSTRKKYL